MITGTGFIAEAAREAEIKARKEERVKIQKTLEEDIKQTIARNILRTSRSQVVKCWHRNIALDAIPFIADLPPKYVDRLIDDCEKVKRALQTYKKALAEISELNETELEEVFKLLASKE
jgi:hypothetical protein